MNYIKIEDCNLLNGDGVRVVLWVAGCEHKCNECHNQDTWSFEAGHKFNDESMLELERLLSNPYISGLTFSGGDPLHKENASEVIKIAKNIKEKFPSKNIWLWTGFLIEQIQKDFRKEIFNYIDMIIDGPYIKTLPTQKKYRGSDNQRRFKIENSIAILLD
ncbi:MAG: anaerobic ribonucleoside-triphosphate reductase activating protein [Mycoplasma sp.]